MIRSSRPYVRMTAMLSYSIGENFIYDSLNNRAQGNDIALRQAVVEGGRRAPEYARNRFWAGQRYYRRHDIHINDFYYLDMSGYGGGVEDVPLGGFGNSRVAWLGGSVDNYMTDDGDVAKQNIDLRIYDIKGALRKVHFLAGLLQHRRRRGPQCLQSGRQPLHGGKFIGLGRRSHSSHRGGETLRRV